MKPNIVMIIPAFNEADSIGRVIDDIPRHLVGEIVVVNNASSDETEANAKNLNLSHLSNQTLSREFVVNCRTIYWVSGCLIYEM